MVFSVFIKHRITFSSAETAFEHETIVYYDSIWKQKTVGIERAFEFPRIVIVECGWDLWKPQMNIICESGAWASRSN